MHTAVADPLVGRVVLAGSLLGTFEAVSGGIEKLILRAVETPPPAPIFAFAETLAGPRAVGQALFAGPPVSMLLAVATAIGAGWVATTVESREGLTWVFPLLR